MTTAPSPPLALPENVRAWARGRPDRAVSMGANGSVTLTWFLPGETLQARFLSAAEAAATLRGEVHWTPLAQNGGSVWRGRREA